MRVYIPIMYRPTGEQPVVAHAAPRPLSVTRRRGTVDKTGQATRARQRVEIIEVHGLDCLSCGRPVDLALTWPHPMSFTRDHVLPRSRGGSDDVANLRASHKVCNESRGSRS